MLAAVLAALGHASDDICCGQQEALPRSLESADGALDPSCLDEHEFVAPFPDEAGNTHEGWPLDRPRRIAMRLEIIPPSPLYSMRREPLGTQGAADQCLAQVVEALAQRPEIQTV